MSFLFIAAAILLALIGIVLTIMAARLLRENRDRSADRVEALRAIAAAPFPPDLHSGAAALPHVPHLPPLPALSVMEDDVWDFDLHEPEVAEMIDEPPAPAPVVPPPAPVVAPPPPVVARPAPVRTASAPAFDEIRPPRQHRASPVAPDRSVQDHPLFEDPIERTPARRWGWMAAACLAMASIIGVAYMASSGVLARMTGPSTTPASAANASPIELLSLRHSTDAGNFVVTGLVQNPAASVAHRGVFVVVYLFDREDRYFATSRAALESTVLSPGGEASFVVRVPASADVSKYRVSFQHEDGAAVIHVDKRGTLPDGTTGDAVTPTRNPPVVNARKAG